MYAGELINLKLRYTGKSVDAILDRLPTAEIIGRNYGEWLIKAEVYGRGILMWLLSQENNVEVIEPVALRNELKGIISRMGDLYEQAT